jgi:hypothetical protein
VLGEDKTMEYKDSSLEKMNGSLRWNVYLFFYNFFCEALAIFMYLVCSFENVNSKLHIYEVFKRLKTPIQPIIICLF